MKISDKNSKLLQTFLFFYLKLLDNLSFFEDFEKLFGCLFCDYFYPTTNFCEKCVDKSIPSII